MFRVFLGLFLFLFCLFVATGVLRSVSFSALALVLFFKVSVYLSFTDHSHERKF